MSRWNIRKIVVYSHDGRRRDVDFVLGNLNIITGPSHSGKSAIVEIIDYCLGAGDCNLPGMVRETTSYVAVVWERDKQRMATARQVPIPSEKAVNEMYWAKGTDTAGELLPASSAQLRPSGNRDAVMRLIEQAFGIGEVASETLSEERPGVRISARHVVPMRRSPIFCE
jgi:hypothetical protein